MLLHWAVQVKGNIWNNFSDFECLWFHFFSRKTGHLNSISLKAYVKIRLKCFLEIQYLQLSSWLLEGRSWGWFWHLLSHRNPGPMEIILQKRSEGMCDGKYWNMDNFSGDFSSLTKTWKLIPFFTHFEIPLFSLLERLRRFQNLKHVYFYLNVSRNGNCQNTTNISAAIVPIK